MIKTKHPTDREQRLLLKKLKDEKQTKAAQERASKVWRKLSREEAKKQETEDDLRQYTNN